MESLKNITVSMPVSLAKWVRVLAANQEKSVSKFIAELLNQKRNESEAYEQSFQQFKQFKALTLSAGKAYPKRADLYD